MKKLLSSLFLLVATLVSFSQGIVLDATTKSYELVTASAGNIVYTVQYYDETSAGAGLDISSSGTITTATTTSIVAAPAASTTRHITRIDIKNTAASSNTITLELDISGTNYEQLKVSLAPSEYSVYSNNLWNNYDANAKIKTTSATTTITGLVKHASKSLTAADAAGYWYCSSKDGGIPGAWSIGTPGVGGRTTAGTSSTDAGAIYFPTTSNDRYLTQVDIAASVIQAYEIDDIVWVNSGLSVTTTTAQTISSVSFPARDDDGTSNGKGYKIGLLATAALGNAAVVSNSTVSYTNSSGTSGRTATLSAIVGSQIPETPVIGTVVWFDLQSGDEGVQSIQSITLNTTLTSGSASLIVARKIAAIPCPTANIAFSTQLNRGDGVKIYNDACLFLFHQANGTGTAQVNVSLTSVER